MAEVLLSYTTEKVSSLSDFGEINDLIYRQLVRTSDIKAYGILYLGLNWVAQSYRA